MAWAAVRSQAVVLLLLLIYCFIYLSLFVGALCWSLFWYALLNVFSIFAIILKRKRELVTFLLLFLMSCYCKCPITFPHGAMGWSAICDCGIS